MSGRRITEERAIARLDALKGRDPEGDHCDADAILLASVSPQVRKAYDRAVERCGGWWFA